MRRSIALAVLAALALAAPLPSSGDHWAGRIGRHVVAPAEARKAPMRGPAVHPSSGSFKIPAFAPPPAVRTLPSAVKAPTFAPPPTPGRIVRGPADTARTPTFKPPGESSGWQASVEIDKSGRGLHEASKDGARPAAGEHRPPRHDATDVKRNVEKASKPAGPLRKEANEDAPAAKPGDSAATGARHGKSAHRRLGARPVGELLPPIASFRPNEVLAINLGAEGLARVRGGNYEPVGRIELPEFGLTITRLKLPEGHNTISGWDRLYDLLPDGGFALNRVYTPYRPGAATGPGGAGVHAAADGKGCTAERCFGATLINWQAPLAACARDVKVGVIDTGFDIGHPAFAGMRYDYKEFLPDGKPRASNRHGTGVLSLLAGHARSGTPGLIPEAYYILANAFYADSEGEPISDTVEMLKALHWLKKSRVAVANLSFSGPADDVLHHGVRELTKTGIVVIAAAGNDGPGAPPGYPAAYEEVIAVTAVDRNLSAYRYANQGDHIDLAAPGVEVWTALPDRREGPQSGTSFAVPYVTAVVAVARGAAGLLPDADPLAAKARALAELRKGIRNLGRPGPDPTFGAGLVQAPAPCDAAAPKIVAAAGPWAGTVRRTLDKPAEPFVLGAWVSTVYTASGNEASR
jgi:subtilisin family serine protease